MLFTASARELKKAAKPATQADVTRASVLESKIRKAWEDYKNQNREAFAAILADDFGEVTNDAEAIFRKDTELAEMDHFNLAHYELRDFHLRPVGNAGALMTYTAEYNGTYADAPIQMKALYGEVSLKAGNDWKLLWVQETKLK